MSQGDISSIINIDYYYGLIQRLVNRMLDKSFNSNCSNDLQKCKCEFQNPSCHMLYMTLCEIMSLELFTDQPETFVKTFCSNIVDMFFVR